MKLGRRQVIESTWELREYCGVDVIKIDCEHALYFII